MEFVGHQNALMNVDNVRKWEIKSVFIIIYSILTSELITLNVKRVI